MALTKSAKIGLVVALATAVVATVIVLAQPAALDSDTGDFSWGVKGDEPLTGNQQHEDRDRMGADQDEADEDSRAVLESRTDHPWAPENMDIVLNSTGHLQARASDCTGVCGRDHRGDAWHANEVVFQIGTGSNAPRFCSGTMITGKYLVTAGHCIITSRTAYGGIFNSDSSRRTWVRTHDGQEALVTRYRFWSRNAGQNDVAVLRLDRTFRNVPTLSMRSIGRGDWVCSFGYACDRSNMQQLVYSCGWTRYHRTCSWWEFWCTPDYNYVSDGIDMTNGQSGGGVMEENPWVLTGVNSWSCPAGFGHLTSARIDYIVNDFW